MIFSLKNFILHSPMFDCNSFLNRKGWVQRDLSEKLGCSQSAIAMWASGRTSPPYAVILQLIELGATADELFGKEYSEKLLKNDQSKNKKIDDDRQQEQKISQSDIEAGVKKVLSEMMGLTNWKNKGENKNGDDQVSGM